VTPSGGGAPLQRERLVRGRRQLIIVGAAPDDMTGLAPDRVRIASLGLELVERAPLRLVASIALAEIARQVGRRRRVPGRPAPRVPTYDTALEVIAGEETLLVDPSELLGY